MKTVIIGCGFAADLYMGTVRNHPEIVVCGAYDTNKERMELFCRYHRIASFASMEEAINAAELILNITNPRSHYAVNRAAILNGKHVYSEKPLAMNLGEAKELVDLASKAGVMLACAPATVLGESAQTMWCAIRDGRVGTPELVFAEICDGPITLLSPENWVSESGAAWPLKNELDTGCTLEHAGYAVSWLTTFFGPVDYVGVTASAVRPDAAITSTPDFTCSVLTFRSGLVARVTCDIFSPRDRRIRVFGDEGVLTVADSWDMASPVTFSSRSKEEISMYRLAAEQLKPGFWPWLRPRELLHVRKPNFRSSGSAKGYARLDFCRGPAELIQAVSEGRDCRLNGKNGLHNLEVVLAMAAPRTGASGTSIQSPFFPTEPMPWAR